MFPNFFSINIQFTYSWKVEKAMYIVQPFVLKQEQIFLNYYIDQIHSYFTNKHSKSTLSH